MAGKNKTGSAVAYCDVHGKLSYTDRKRAKEVARQHSEHKNAYRCDDNPNHWHIGALPPEVRRGHLTKSEYYGRAAA